MCPTEPLVGVGVVEVFFEESCGYTNNALTATNNSSTPAMRVKNRPLRERRGCVGGNGVTSCCCNPGSRPAEVRDAGDFDDTFEYADQSILDELASWAGITPAELAATLKQRTDCLEELSQGQGADMHQMYRAINALRNRSKKL